MGGYRHQIPEAKDRWAVAAYIRALQKSQNANRGHVVRYAPKKVQEVDAEFVRAPAGRIKGVSMAHGKQFVDDPKLTS